MTTDTKTAATELRTLLQGQNYGKRLKELPEASLQEIGELVTVLVDGVLGPVQEPVQPSFDDALKSFVAKVNEMVKAHYAENHPDADQHLGLSAPTIAIDPRGKKYIRITEGDAGGPRSVWCFVERATGNILKAEGWKRPAKHARGNIYDADPLAGVNVHGPNYLR